MCRLDGPGVRAEADSSSPGPTRPRWAMHAHAPVDGAVASNTRQRLHCPEPLRLPHALPHTCNLAPSPSWLAQIAALGPQLDRPTDPMARGAPHTPRTTGRNRASGAVQRGARHRAPRRGQRQLSSRVRPCGVHARQPREALKSDAKTALEGVRSNRDDQPHPARARARKRDHFRDAPPVDSASLNPSRASYHAPEPAGGSADAAVPEVQHIA